MPKRRIVDSSKLIDAVEEGRLDKEIIKKFGLQPTRRTRDRNVETRAARDKTGRQSGKRIESGAEPVGSIKVNEWGSLILPKNLTTVLNMFEGDRFVIRKTKAGIFLKRLP